MAPADSFLEPKMKQYASNIIERDICIRCAPKDFLYNFFELSHAASCEPLVIERLGKGASRTSGGASQ